MKNCLARIKWKAVDTKRHKFYLLWEMIVDKICFGAHSVIREHRKSFSFLSVQINKIHFSQQ